MKNLTALLLALATAMLTGCAAVRSDRPLGATAVAIKPEAMDGVWTYQGGSVHLATLDKAQGLLELAWIERRDGKFAIKTARVNVLRQDDVVFASLEEKYGVFIFGRIKLEPEAIIVWLPDFARFKKLIEEKRLAGKVNSDNEIMLTNLEEKQMRIIADRGERLFNLEHPVVLKRAVKLDYQK